jgi:hypothetical protein
MSFGRGAPKVESGSASKSSGPRMGLHAKRIALTLRVVTDLALMWAPIWDLSI